MKSFKYFCNQREAHYRKINEMAPAAPGAAPAAAPTPGAQAQQSKTLPLVQKGMTDMLATMQKNPADPNLSKMSQDLTKNITTWQQELLQASKAPAAPAAVPGAPAPGVPGLPANFPGLLAKAPGT